MTTISTRYTDNIIPWGWKNLGHGPAGVQMRLPGFGHRKIKADSHSVANVNYAPLGQDIAVTSDLGIALLSRIVGV